jgi:hypothetical protein
VLKTKKNYRGLAFSWRMPQTARSTQSSNDYWFIIFLLVVLVYIENETHGECHRAQICSEIVRFPSIKITVLLVIFSLFRYTTARFYMSVSRSGRNSGRHHVLCETLWAVGIHSGKGLEFYSLCHFVQVSPCTNPTNSTGKWLARTVQIFTYFSVYFVHFPSKLSIFLCA